MKHAINSLFTFLDYSSLQSKIQGISNGGSLNFQYLFDDKSCGSICKSKQVRKGCEFGFECNVSFKCQNSNCLCTLQMSCTNGKHENGNPGNSVTFEGGSGNSATISAEFLGLLTNQIPIY